MAGEYLVALRVVRAHALPKTDTFSKIDPFVKVFVDKNNVYRTSAKDDNDEPVWNELFSFSAPVDSSTGMPSATVVLELYDEDKFSSSHVGTATFNLKDIPYCRGVLELPLAFTKSKYNQGKPSRVIVAAEGCAYTYSTLRNILSSTPGVFFNDAARRMYIPIPQAQGAVYIGVEYEKACIDVKAFVTVPNAPFFLDLVLSGVQHTKIRRRIYQKGEQLVPGLVAYEELKMDDIPLTVNFNELLLMLSIKHQEFAINAGEVAQLHGWQGSLNFKSASRTLRDIIVDEKEEEIYMSMPPGTAPDMLFVVDYDKSDADIKLVILASPEGGTKGYDLTVLGQNIKKTSEVFVPPRIKCNGRIPVMRIFELDDLPYGSTLRSIWVYKYGLSDTKQVPIGTIVPLRRF